MRDEMGDSFFAALINTRAIDYALPRLAAQPDSPWWDNRETSNIEDRTAIVTAAWQASLEHLRSTLGAKTAAVLMAPAFYLLTLMDADLFFNAVIIFHIVVALEEMLITSVLTQPRSNVRSILSIVGSSKLVE